MTHKPDMAVVTIDYLGHTYNITLDEPRSPRYDPSVIGRAVLDGITEMVEWHEAETNKEDQE